VTEPQDESGGRVGLVGKTLGRYRISAELGRGGMATVYRAFDPQLARDVAVKVIHGAFTGRGDIERRFRREAQAVAALKHDAIVDVFDFAPGGDGEPAYIVSEMVEGPTLRQLVERAGGRVMPEVAVGIASRVAAALGAAHARGIVHRDVKPDNVMIDFGKATSRVLLTDFGIARMIEDDTMTATGSILGSPSYMSPEQAKSGAVGPASDVFSLGVTLYQMVVGRTPFPGKDPLTVIAALLAGEFLRPSQLDAHVGPELEAVILRCLKRVPEERYADGNALLAALRAVSEVSARTIGDEAAAVRAFHEDREAFERRVGRGIADAAVEAGRGCVKRGELTRALAHINRALAYAPDHRGAEALLRTISSRRRWVKVALVGGAVLAAAAGVAGVRARARQAAPVVVGPAPPAGAQEPPHLPAPASAVVTPQPEPPQPVALAPQTGQRVRERGTDEAPALLPPLPPRKRERPKRPSAPAVAPASAAAAPVPEPAPAVSPPIPTPPPAVAPAPAPAPTAGITLRARQGFCSPSLDERAPALRPIYQGVPVGRHKVYCTIPGQGRALAGTYELRAGTHPDLVIVPGPDGRPTLALPE
jgi:serine/threonine-protein kinase